jgi:hypothetical protein
MSTHYAITNSRDIGRGIVFTVRSGALRRLDVIDLQLGDDERVEAVIEQFDPTGLTIRLNGTLCKCRPWQMGDAAIRRLPGTASTWTIDQVLEAEDAVA